MLRFVRPLLALVLLALAFPVRAEPPAPGGNLLLVTLDTTRADHLSAYGYRHPTSPHLDRLAAEGVLFEEASTQIPLTGPAHASLMTSRHPRNHGAIRNGVPIRDDLPTLAEVLSARGYSTAAFISGWTLKARLTGLNRGFRLYDDRLDDRYRFVNTQRSADEITSLATEWLRRNHQRPFFLWVHYFDPHAPYKRHADHYRAPDPGSGSKTENGFSREKIARYDSEIGFVDYQLGLLLQELERLGRRDDTLIAVTADHGESFGEHAYIGHGRRVYEPNLRIPLILRYPGILPASLRSSFPAQTIDLMPTLLRLLGLPAPEGLEGRDLVDVLEADTPPPDPEIYFETFAGARKRFWKIFSPPMRGVPLRVGKRIGPWKYIYDPKQDRHELYHTRLDPGETENRIAEHPEFLSLGRDCLDRFQNPTRTAQKRELDPEDRKVLESLGYVE